MSKKDREEHPSYVTVGFSRYTGSTGPMFGSSLKSHPSGVRLRVYRAYREHDLASDHYFSATRHPLIEVDLTEVQFATLVSTLNVGDGTPATLRYLNGEGNIPHPPATDGEAEKVASGFPSKAKDVARKLSAARELTRSLLAQPRVTKADLQQVLAEIDAAVMEISANMPFVEKMFREAMERTVVAAKVEVDAFVTGVIVRTGLTVLREYGSKLLESGGEDRAEPRVIEATSHEE